MINMIRARWYELTHMLPFWGFLILIAGFAAAGADSTWRFGPEPLGDNAVSIQERMALAGFVLGVALIWFLSFLGDDERNSVASIALVGPQSRVQWVGSALVCYISVLACFAAAFVAAAGCAVMAWGHLPAITVEAVTDFLRFFSAFLVVAMAYGGLLLLSMVVLRRTVAGLAVLLMLVGGVVEHGLAQVLILLGAGNLAMAWGPYTLFAQLSLLCGGGIPSLGALGCAAVTAVASTALSAMFMKRRCL